MVSRNPFEPMVASLKVWPPAISGGIVIWMTILFFIGVARPGFNDSLKLQKSTITNLELNRLTFYPMLHLSLLHLGLNCWALLPLLSSFELQNGTVRTGIVLNALGTVTGLMYIACSFVFFPNGSVLGSSAWVFSFFSYFSYLESKHTPFITLYRNVRVPTVSKPILLLTVTALLVPGSSIIGHSFGILAGWLLAMGKLKFMTDPPSKVVVFIESKIGFLINLIPRSIRYIKEVEAIEIRKTSTHAPQVLPMSEINVPRSSNFVARANSVGFSHGAATAAAAALGNSKAVPYGQPAMPAIPTAAAAAAAAAAGGGSSSIGEGSVSAPVLNENAFKGDGYVLGSTENNNEQHSEQV